MLQDLHVYMYNVYIFQSVFSNHEQVLTDLTGERPGNVVSQHICLQSREQLPPQLQQLQQSDPPPSSWSQVQGCPLCHLAGCHLGCNRSHHGRGCHCHQVGRGGIQNLHGGSRCYQADHLHSCRCRQGCTLTHHGSRCYQDDLRHLQGCSLSPHGCHYYCQVCQGCSHHCYQVYHHCNDLPRQDYNRTHHDCRCCLDDHCHSCHHCQGCSLNHHDCRCHLDFPRSPGYIQNHLVLGPSQRQGRKL